MKLSKTMKWILATIGSIFLLSICIVPLVARLIFQPASLKRPGGVEKATRRAFAERHHGRGTKHLAFVTEQILLLLFTQQPTTRLAGIQESAERLQLRIVPICVVDETVMAGIAGLLEQHDEGTMRTEIFPQRCFQMLYTCIARSLAQETETELVDVRNDDVILLRDRDEIFETALQLVVLLPQH